MYAPFNSPSVAVQQIALQMSQSQASMGPDGLTLGPPPKSIFSGVEIPPRLQDKLLAIRLLTSIPLSYMVPDAALLPPESIRFFFVDQTWVDRVTDGLLSAANAGSVDVGFSCGLNQLIRQSLDTQLSSAADAAVRSASGNANASAGWNPATHPMTGMLIRSDIVRRWPTMNIRAFQTTSSNSAPIGVLRAEPISTGILIALFAGIPQLVQVGEPHVGVRFGVEAANPLQPEAGVYQVDLRDETCKELVNVTLPVPLRTPAAQRVIEIGAFAQNAIAAINKPPHTGAAVLATSRIVAIELARQPWVQDFVNDAATGLTEATGIESSVDANGKPITVTLSNGRTLSSLTRLAAQQAKNA